MFDFDVRRFGFWIVLMLASFGSAQADGSWEMRVCADPYGYPLSSQDEPGVFNAIADVLADVLGATVTYEWTHLTADSVERTLLSGKCDLIIGMTEGSSGVNNTVPIARVPYVFVSLAEHDIDISSLSDPRLHELRIGTYMGGIPSMALQNRGIFDNVTEIPFITAPTGPDLDTPILQALTDNRIDVAIIYGPPAAGFAAQTGIDLNIIPLAEEIEFAPSMLQFFRTLTIGVRPGDAALRDSLDIAITQQWDQIQDLMADYGIPLLPQVKPEGIPPVNEELTTIALVAPLATGAPIADEKLGESARFGAQLAEYFIGRAGSDRTVPVQLILASAPDDASALRAADRILTLNNPDAIIGGFNHGQAMALAELATEHETVFFNIAVQSDEFRRESCRLNVFHIEASESQYVAALIDWFGTKQGFDDWFVVHENTTAGTALMAATAAKLQEVGLQLVGTSAVAERQFAYMNEIRAIQEAEADVVLLLLSDDEQILFHSQARNSVGAQVTGLAGPMSQRREAIFRMTQDAGPDQVYSRSLLWEASFDEGSAEDINQSFLPRAGEPMAATGWATFAATLMTYMAALEDVDLAEWLQAEETVFDLGKGEASAYFGPGNRQLQQPLYIVSGVEGAAWSRVAMQQVNAAELTYVSHPVVQSDCE